VAADIGVPLPAARPDAVPDVLGGIDDRLATAAARVEAALAGQGPLGVAYSGGVDSAVLLALAVRALGPSQVVAMLGVSPSLPAAERAGAHATAAGIGVRIVEVATAEGERPEYRRNGPDRCFYCKDELFRRIDAEVVERFGLAAIAYGENADDAVRPDRPGSVSARERGVLRPLADAGLGKADVRTVAKALGLPVWDKPAAPCLASRIPHFSEVSPEKLAQVDRAEAALHMLGLADLRVRHHGEVARVELTPPDLARATTDPLRTALREAVLAAGFRYVTVDLDGLRSGAFTLTALGR
jgi:uncharacterized protein